MWTEIAKERAQNGVASVDGMYGRQPLIPRVQAPRRGDGQFYRKLPHRGHGTVHGRVNDEIVEFVERW